MDYSISFIGSGKVATQLAIALFNKGIKINQIFSRSEENAQKLASQVAAETLTSIKQLKADSDIYIIAVTDDAIPVVQELLPLEIRTEKLVVHTSGFTSINTLSSVLNAGVFYPLNTFTSTSEVDFKTTPIFIDARNDKDILILNELASMLSDIVEKADDNMREQLHIAAVIVSNFTIGLLGMGNELMEEVNLPMKYLKPLMEKTCENCLNHPPNEIITGPAIRGDIDVIERHLRKLKDHPTIEKIYALMTYYITENL